MRSHMMRVSRPSVGPTLVGSATATVTGSTNLVISKPSGVIDGDILVSVLKHQLAAQTWTGDTGWTELLDNYLRAARKTASSEGGSYTFVASANNGADGGVVAYRGAVYDTIGTIGAGSTAPATASSITVAANNSKLLAIFGCGFNGVTFSTPAGMTPVCSANFSASFAIFEQTVSAGATGSYASNLSGGNTGRGFLLALGPA